MPHYHLLEKDSRKVYLEHKLVFNMAYFLHNILRRELIILDENTWVIFKRFFTRNKLLERILSCYDFQIENRSDILGNAINNIVLDLERDLPKKGPYVTFSFENRLRWIDKLSIRIENQFSRKNFLFRDEVELFAQIIVHLHHIIKCDIKPEKSNIDIYRIIVSLYIFYSLEPRLYRKEYWFLNPINSVDGPLMRLW